MSLHRDAREWLVLAVKCDHDARYGRRPSVRELVRRAERANVLIMQIQERRSKGGTGFHRLVYVRVPGPVVASWLHVVALQLLFGSDPLREAYNYNRARVVDAGAVPPYWAEQKAWDVLYKSPARWRFVNTQTLAAHRERNGDARTVNARDRKKG